MSEPHPARILLLCAGGFSTSLLKASIMKAADSAGLELELYVDFVDGVAYRDFRKEPFDVILLAPQVRIFRKSITKRVEPFGIIVQVMDSTAFGMADGEKLLQQIQEALEKYTTCDKADPELYQWLLMQTLK